MHARALIDLDALRANVARACAAGGRVIAVVKADAYGHGALRVAAAIEARVGAFGVARVEEGLALRGAGVARPVIVLSGAVTPADLEAAAAAGLEVVVHDDAQIDALRALPGGSSLRVWLKVDTGMSRLGFSPAALPGAWSRLRALAAVPEPPRLMTHLANADDRADPTTDGQIAAFLECTAPLAAERSICNSAGLLGWPRAHAEWVRPGLMLYGISPFVDGAAADEGLRPVMTLASRLIAVHDLPRGRAVGYGGTFVCPQDMRVGVAAIGYGDGYPRAAPGGTPVLVGGRRAALVGRVSMDMVSIDLRTAPDARAGDEVVLWGAGLPVEEVARHAGTIPYELVCRVGARVERVEAGGGPG